MGEKVQTNRLIDLTREQILLAFPKLATDKVFQIKSPVDHNYNCIAWSGIKNNIIWWPFITKLDGTDWPFDLPRSESLETFTKLYEVMGYEECDNHNFEHHLMKIAIYQNKTTGNCTHAARQTVEGYWTSKLGPQNDIIHQDPFTLEGKEYGHVVKIMKRQNTSFDIKRIKML